MKERPKRENYTDGIFGSMHYELALENYIDYLLRYYVKTKKKFENK